MSRLTYDEWFDKYHPIINEIAGDEQYQFETYGDELQYVLQQDDRHIWTEMDGDNGVYIVSGYHLVNRIQYYITTKPWKEDIEIPVVAYKECDCVSEGEANIDCSECDGNHYITIWIDTREEMEEIYGTQNV